MSQHAWRRRTTTVSMLVLASLAACARSAPPRGASAGSSRPTHVSNPVGSSMPAMISATTTATRVFAAYRPDGAPTAGVVAHRPGTCFSSSILVATARAYRCIAGNRILDPCFAGPSPTVHSLACYADPWSRATELTLTSRLPRPAPLRITRPWALELADGHRCVATAGTIAADREGTLDYRCDSGMAGVRSATGPAWQARYVPANGAARQISVIVVWKA